MCNASSSEAMAGRPSLPPRRIVSYSAMPWVMGLKKAWPTHFYSWMNNHIDLFATPCFDDNM